MPDRLESQYMTIWMDGPLLCCRYADNLYLTLEIAKSVVEERILFSKGKDYPVLVDMRGIKSVTKEAREYLATVGSTFVTAGALITGSMINMALGNIFLTVDKPSVPTRLFTDEAKAKEWLRSFITDPTRPII